MKVKARKARYHMIISSLNWLLIFVLIHNQIAERSNSLKLGFGWIFTPPLEPLALSTWILIILILLTVWIVVSMNENKFELCSIFGFCIRVSLVVHIAIILFLWVYYPVEMVKTDKYKYGEPIPAPTQFIMPTLPNERDNM